MISNSEISEGRMSLFPVSLDAFTEMSVLIGPPGDMCESPEFGDLLNNANNDNSAANTPRITVELPVGSELRARKSVPEIPTFKTPKTSGPEELVSNMRAGELVVSDAVGQYVQHAIDASDVDTMRDRIHARVVDPEGNARGVHIGADLVGTRHNRLDYNVVLTHQATRGFVTGALRTHMGFDTLGFAQKISTLRAVKNGGYVSSMYARSGGMATKNRERFVDRAGDRNLSDWATQQLVGGLGIAIAVARTPLVEGLEHLSSLTNEQRLSRTKKLNQFRLDDEGNLIIADNLPLFAVNFEQEMSEMVLDGRLLEYTDIPPEYVAIAEERRAFCEDYRAVLLGDQPYSTMADRADWAAKLWRIVEQIESAEGGENRTVGDLESIADDLRFDSVIKEYSAESAPKKVHVGLGHRLRTKPVQGQPAFKGTTSNSTRVVARTDDDIFAMIDELTTRE